MRLAIIRVSVWFGRGGMINHRLIVFKWGTNKRMVITGPLNPIFTRARPLLWHIRFGDCSA